MESAFRDWVTLPKGNFSLVIVSVILLGLFLLSGEQDLDLPDAESFLMIFFFYLFSFLRLFHYAADKTSSSSSSGGLQSNTSTKSEPITSKVPTVLNCFLRYYWVLWALFSWLLLSFVFDLPCVIVLSSGICPDLTLSILGLSSSFYNYLSVSAKNSFSNSFSSESRLSTRYFQVEKTTIFTICKITRAFSHVLSTVSMSSLSTQNLAIFEWLHRNWTTDTIKVITLKPQSA